MQKSLQNINNSKLKSTEHLKDLMNTVLDLAKKNGATDASVSVNMEDGYSVDVRMGEVDTLAFHESKSVGVTVYFDNQKGNASSTDTTHNALESMVAAACDIAKVSADDPCFGLADINLVTNDYPNLDLYHPWSIQPDKAIELALTCEKHAMSKDVRISNSDGTSVSTYNLFNGFADSFGRQSVSKSSNHTMSCSLIADKGDSMQRDYDYTTSCFHEGLISAEKLAEQAASRVISRLGARKIKTQNTAVLFSSRISKGLFSSFISAISGMNIYRKNTFLLDAKGLQIFPKEIIIHEQPHIIRGLGSSVDDAEGVLTRNNVFVENGVLQQYVLGSYSARKLGLETTANASGVHNLTVEPTAGDLQEMLARLGTGLLVTELMGQGVNILTGDYSRGACGFWVEGGEIKFPAEEITIAGNLKEMFKNIVAVGSDINPNYSSRCGSVLISKMMVAGE